MNVRNVSGQKCRISVYSNLQQQVLIFSDRDLRTLSGTTTCGPEDVLEVFVAVSAKTNIQI
jgi:hypothetical protein